MKIAIFLFIMTLSGCYSDRSYLCSHYESLGEFNYCPLSTGSKPGTGGYVQYYDAKFTLQDKDKKYKYQFEKLLEFCCLYLKNNPEIHSMYDGVEMNFFNVGMDYEDMDAGFYRRHFLGKIILEKVKNGENETYLKVASFATYGYNAPKTIPIDKVFQCIE